MISKTEEEHSRMQKDFHVAGNHEIETYSGLFIDIFDPDPADVRLEDIAHALSHTCRFSGHCRRFYSVAEHVCLVERAMELYTDDPDELLCGLHHDDDEGYLTDVPKPIKPLLGSEYKSLSGKVEKAIWDALELPGWTARAYRLMKESDEWALSVEAKILLPSEGQGWFTEGLDARVNYDVELGMRPEYAKDLYLETHEKLVALR